MAFASAIAEISDLGIVAVAEYGATSTRATVDGVAQSHGKRQWVSSTTTDPDTIVALRVLSVALQRLEHEGFTVVLTTHPQKQQTHITITPAL